MAWDQAGRQGYRAWLAAFLGNRRDTIRQALGSLARQLKFPEDEIEGMQQPVGELAPQNCEG